MAASILAHRSSTAVDRLTGLASRTAILDLAGEALTSQRGAEGGAMIALMVLDVVDMASVNEAVGSDGGDR
ncbi:MAG: hypothetical protein M4D85_13335, partial [Actinomycetota bacterium]|nr:hypothetical protein [Actinomycetota bacterium]